MRVPEATREAIAIHQAAGRRFEAGGVQSFVRDQPPSVGTGSAVVLVHGVPSSSFLYRKMIPALAQQGLRAVAFDFPGLGLADRPEDFDYSWSGLSRWMGEAIDALGIDRCHLVVHDIGGPIACEWAVRNPERVLSLTALNTMLGVAGFKRPWSMQPFAIRGVGKVWLGALRPLPMSQLYAYYFLLKRADGGRAFLRIMRGFELTEEKQRFLWEGLAKRSYPARIVWGERDPALGHDQLRLVQEALEVPDPILLPAKHFLQEDQAIPVANAITDLAAPLG
jgi:haloalkane dehalogenase